MKTGFRPAFIALALFTASCGRMGDPVPPGQASLSTPEGLVIRGRENGLAVAWSMPSPTLAGGPGEVAAFSIERAEVPAGKEDCPSCAGEYAEAGKIPREPGTPLSSWTDSSALPGKTYSYRVIAEDGRGRAGAPSIPVTATYYRLEKPSVEAVPADGGAKVRYSLDPTVHYEGVTVYGPGGKLLSILEEGKTEGRITGLINKEAVALEFRSSAVTPQGWRVESAPVVVALTPRDDEPPLPPSELAAFGEAGGVRLMWITPGGEKYDKVYIYRGSESEGFARIAETPGSEGFYIDRTAAPGVTYEYGCTGVDAEGNESGMSPKSKAAATEIKQP